MAETQDYVESLSGEEIINDLCALLAAKLRSDCNLRETDSYQGGYMATVKIHLEAYGLDTATVEAEVATGKEQEHPDELIDDTLEIPVEPALNVVRERSAQPVPTLATNDQGQPEVRPRRYVRRGGGMAGGGATGEAL